MKKHKKLLIVLVSIIVVIIATIFFGSREVTKLAREATEKQINVDIDMSKVKDGTYSGKGDGGMVKADVSVTVKDHKITDIQLLEHKTLKGKPAESTIDTMIANNTDNVDGVSGATCSSKTIRNAVNKALQQGLK